VGRKGAARLEGRGPRRLDSVGSSLEGIKRRGGERGEHHSAPPIRISYMQRLGKGKGQGEGKGKAKGREGN
jgi:hypothetical protein